MKKLILTCILTICLIASLAICLTVYADNTTATTNTSSAESTTNSQVDVVRDMIEALPDVEKVKTMGYSDKYKAYVDMQAADAAYKKLSQEEKDSLGFSFQTIENIESYFNINPLPSGNVNYGFLMDQTLVTPNNLSGNGWSYDPNTQTLTLGDENEVTAYFDTVPQNTNNYWRKQYKKIDGVEREVFYTAVIQPVVVARNENDNTCTFSHDRPSNLKIDVKRMTSFGHTSWSRRWGQYSEECDKYFEMGGILWDGNLEITGAGLLSLHATTCAIGVTETLNIHDTDLQAQAYNNAIYCAGELKITNSTVDVRSNSLGAQHYDLRYKRDNGEPDYISDSMEAIYCDTGTIKDSTVTADAAWNRVYTTENVDGDYSYFVTALFAQKYLTVYNSFVIATAHIDEGWQYPSQQNATICGIRGSLHLYDDAFVFSKTYADSYFSSHSDQLSKVYFYGWDGNNCYGYGNAVLIGATEYNSGKGSAFFDMWGSPIKALEGVQYTISTPENYSGRNRLIVEYRKDDTLYLRDQDGKKQASWKMDFSDCVELESNVVDEVDFTSQVEGRSCNVRVASGNFIFNALPNSQADRFFETLGGSLTVQLDKGENYGDVHVFTAPYSSVTLQGEGTIENLIVKPHIRINHKDYDVETGSLIIDVATVKNCQIDTAYKNNVTFEGGNVKVDISNLEYYRKYFKLYYDTMIYDFNNLSETVDLAKNGMSTNNYYDARGAQLIDGKFYFYAKKTEAESLSDFVKYAYVKPTVGYNYYMLPEKVDKEDDITTFTFKRAAETLRFHPEEKIKYAYVSNGEKDVTIDAGYMQAYVTDSAITSGDGFALTGSETQTLPEGHFAKWFYTDEKTGAVTVLVAEGQSLLYTINNVVLEDEFRTYTCEVYRKDGWYHIPIGSYSIKPRIMIMSASPSSNTIYVKVGDTVPLKLTFDENCRDNWRQDLVVVWQARKDANSDWTGLPSNTKHNPTYNLKFTDEEMISWEYRALVCPLIRPIGIQSAPDYYSDSIFFCKRDTKFNGTIDNISGKNGEYCAVSVGITDGYLSSIECYWERSQDGGKTWSKVIHDGDTFTIVALEFSRVPVGGGSSVSYITSSSLSVKLDSSLNSDKLRAVIYDKLSDTYVYTNESLITITDHVHEWSTTEIITKVDADCEKDGKLTHWHCNSCGNDYDADQKTIINDLTIKSSGHDYGDLIVQQDAKCTESGVCAHYECSKCHKLFDENKEETTENSLTISAIGHNTDGSIAHKDAKCTETGVVGGTYCTRCNDGKTAAEAVIPALGHSNSSAVEENRVESTCTELGHYDSVIYCSRCTAEVSRTEKPIDALGHDEQDHSAQTPTCTAIGWNAYVTCSRCSYTTYSELKALGHNTDGSIAHKDTKCTEAGVVGGTYCTRCNDGKKAAEAVIPALGHKFSTAEIIAEVPATCTSTGTKAHWHCNVCNGDFDAQNVKLDDLTIAIDPNAHKFGAWIEKVPATMESIGTVGHKDCEHCNKHFDASGAQIADLTIPKLPKVDDDPDADKGLSTGAIVGVAVGSTAVAATGGFAIAWFAVKKKSFADLVHAIKRIFKK